MPSTRRISSAHRVRLPSSARPLARRAAGGSGTIASRQEEAGASGAILMGVIGQQVRAQRRDERRTEAHRRGLRASR